MSDLSDFSMVRNLVGSIDKTLDIGQLLQEKDLARRVSGESRKSNSSLLFSSEQATAKPVVGASEKLFVITPPSAKSPVIRGFKEEQQFEGTVVAVNLEDGTFTARLADLTGDNSDEEGEFLLSELNGDQNLVIPGAIFTWTIGLQTRGPQRQQIRVSDIRFRRLPSISQQAISDAEAKGLEFSKFLRETDSAEPFVARQ